MSRNERPTVVSLIVPVYNAAAHLPACIESLRRLRYRYLELIFVDDGSTDGSAEILDAFREENRWQSVRVIHRENAGVSAARNTGIDAATGDFIGFVDSDDTVEPDYVKTLLRAFNNYPGIDVSICNRFIHGHPNGQTVGGTAGAGRELVGLEAARYALSIGQSFEGYLWNKLFRAEIFREQKNGKPRFRLDPEISVCEDLLLCVEIFAEDCCAYYDPTPLYHYHYRESSALRTLDEKRLSEFAARDRIEAILKEKGNSILHTAELSRVKSALNLLYEAKQRHDPRLKKRMKQEIDARLFGLLRAPDIPKQEKKKLLIRRAFPVRSMRAYLRERRKSNG